VRREERFDVRKFAGGRQTSNRYEILRHPWSDSPDRASSPDDLAFTLVDDTADPNQLELADDRAELSSHPMTAPEPMPAAPAASLPEQRGEAFAPVTSAVLDGVPLRNFAPPPFEEPQGVKEREKLREEANSTRTREPSPECRDRAQPNAAAAFLDEVLPTETQRALKARFGVTAFASVLFALRRNTCQEHPAVAKRALARLMQAQDVRNPGAYFFCVFEAERSAASLVGPPSPADLALEQLRARESELTARWRQLRAAHHAALVCGDLDRTAALQVELDRVNAERRRVGRVVQESATAALAPASVLSGTSSGDAAKASAAPSPVDLDDEDVRALAAMRAVVDAAPLPAPGACATSQGEALASDAPEFDGMCERDRELRDQELRAEQRELFERIDRLVAGGEAEQAVRVRRQLTAIERERREIWPDLAWSAGCAPMGPGIASARPRSAPSERLQRATEPNLPATMALIDYGAEAERILQLLGASPTRQEVGKVA
jgi:hypothetical protein